MRKLTLAEQLLLICALIIAIVVISLGIILPKSLLPTYEENLYNYLDQSLKLLEKPENDKIDSDIAYIFVDDNNILISNNLKDMFTNEEPKTLLKKVTSNRGKFTYKNKIYYYSTDKNDNIKKIAITGNSYINTMKKDILRIILVEVGITFIIVSLVVIIWSNSLVNRIKKLKDKIDNINNDEYNHNMIYNYDDELYTLEVAIENMRIYLKKQDEYKNQMYQNISHDFKTPITVMKSYIEANEDGIESNEKTMSILKEQLKKLEIKVHSLLYLNKLEFFKEQKDKIKENCDISKIIFSSVDKFSPSRPEVEFELDIDKKSTIMRGSEEMWEAIIDNILNNFMRYAKEKIKITVKNHKIILFNDGPNIEKEVLNNIFTPYEKGVKGIFGLGLSIVQKTLHLLSYDITIENEKNGVKFIIS